jgi:hypothetical protein
MLNIQATGNLYGETVTVKQISKAAAKKLFAAGEVVYLQSSNMHPFGLWQSICPIKLDFEQLKSSKEYYSLCEKNGYKLPCHLPNESGQFDAIVNEYRYYNCDGERGKYIHFYHRIK